MHARYAFSSFLTISIHVRRLLKRQLSLAGAAGPEPSTVYVDTRALRNDRVTLVGKGAPNSLALLESGKLLPGVRVVIANAETRGQCADSHLGEVRWPFELFAPLIEKSIYRMKDVVLSGLGCLSSQFRCLLHCLRRGNECASGPLQCSFDDGGHQDEVSLHLFTEDGN